MGKSLYIAEKPSVAQEFARVLKINGQRRNGYLESADSIVTWCVGHLVSMSYPEKYDMSLKRWSFDTLPFLPRTFRYEVIDSVKDQFAIVKDLLNRPDVETIYVCTDSGREGEYIYRLVAMMAGVKGKNQKRVWIDSQTEEEILRGIREAKDLSAYDNLGTSAFLRAKEDYLMGINFSRALSLRYAYAVSQFLGEKYQAISVGRVMTCVLGMVVRREREIRAFVKTPFYRVIGAFSLAGEAFDGEWRAAPGSRYYGSPLLYKENGFKKREDAEALIGILKEGGLPEDELPGSAPVPASQEGSVPEGAAPLAGKTAEGGAPEGAAPLAGKAEEGSASEGAVPLAVKAAEGSVPAGNLPLAMQTAAGAQLAGEGIMAAKPAADTQEGRPGAPADGDKRPPVLTGRLEKAERKKEKKNPPMLFNLAELQNTCSRLFKISPDQTLQIAQELYEKKLTTYPRTDAHVLSTAVAKEIGKNLQGLTRYSAAGSLAKAILDKGAEKGLERTRYVNDKQITDHYAIIPTGAGLSALASLDITSQKVYEVIVRRFLSIFYPPAVYQKISLIIKVGEESFFSSFRVLLEEGYLPVAAYSFMKKNAEEDKKPSKAKGEGEEEEDISCDDALKAALQKLKKGDLLPVRSLSIREGETSPPKRYNSGSMILAMENAGQLIEDEELRAQIKGAGIGTSATRAEILKKLFNIRYLDLNKKTQIITPTQMGEMVYDVVDDSIRQLLNPELTASWEKGLTYVAEGTIGEQEYMDKLEKFVRVRTLNVREKQNTGQLRRKFQETARFYGQGRRKEDVTGK